MKRTLDWTIDDTERLFNSLTAFAHRYGDGNETGDLRERMRQFLIRHGRMQEPVPNTVE